MQRATAGSLKSSVVDCRAIVKKPKVAAAKTDIVLAHRSSCPIAKTTAPATAVTNGLIRDKRSISCPMSFDKAYIGTTRTLTPIP